MVLRNDDGCERVGQAAAGGTLNPSAAEPGSEK